MFGLVNNVEIVNKLFVLFVQIAFERFESVHKDAHKVPM